MFGVVRECQPPTGVTHAARGRFGLPSGSWGLVFARKTSIDLFVVRANSNTARLELIQSTPIGATIISLSVLRRTASAGDVLWLGFDNMRIVALTWDANSRSWIQEQRVELGSLLGYNLCNLPDVMVGMDSADSGRKLLRGRTGSVVRPVIRSDPSGRCIAILAEKQDLVYVVPHIANEENIAAGGGVVNSDDVFIIDLKSSYNASNVKDIVFLQGTFEPNIVVLYEPKRTWSGRAAVQRLTSHLLAVSIDVRSKRHSKIWVMEKLSYDCFKLEAVPESAEGGVLVLAPNVIMQVRHGACVAGLSLNCFGDAYASESKGTYDAITKSDTLMSLDAGHCRFLDWEEQGLSGNAQNTGLLSLKGGELYFLTLPFGSNNSLQMQRAGSTVLASEIVPISERFFVLASRLSDSLLVEYQKSDEEVLKNDRIGNGTLIATDQGAAENGSSDQSVPTNPRKRPRSVEEEAEYEMYGIKPSQESDDDRDEKSVDKVETLELEDQDEATRGVYDDEDELGWVFSKSMEDEKASKESIKAGKWALKVKDTLPCFGPGNDLTVGLNPESQETDILDMVIAGGYAKNGCLAVVHQTIRPKDNRRLNLPDCNGCWTLRDPSFASQQIADRDARNKVISRRNEDCRARNTKRKAARKRFIEKFIADYRKTQLEEIKRAPTKDLEAVDVVANDNHPPDGPSANGHENARSTSNAADDAENKPAPSEAQNNGSDSSRAAKRLKTAVSDTEGKEATAVESSNPVKHEDVPIPPEVIQQAEEEADTEEKFQLESEEALEDVLNDEESFYSYILLSTASSTVVLSSGMVLNPIDGKSVNIVTNEPTISAGNMFKDRISVQVTKSRVRILKSGAVQCEHIRPIGAPGIKNAHVLDPQVLFVTEDGRTTVLTVRAEEFTESKAEAGSASSSNDMDLVVDEYGIVLNPSNEGVNVLSPNNKGDKNGTSTFANNVQVNGSSTLLSSLRNISIHVDYESAPPSGSSDAVTCACLYRGSFGADSIRDGLGSLSTNGIVDTAANESVERREENSTDNIEQPPAEALKEEETIEDDVDEEDRMLYGDEVDGEEELMLYGTVKEETVKAELALPSGIIGSKSQDRDTSAVTFSKNLSHVAAPAEVRAQEKGVLPLDEARKQYESMSDSLLVTVTKSGSLEIRAQALDFAVVLRCDHFFIAPTIVFDSANETSNVKLRAPRKHRIKTILMTEVTASAAVQGMCTPILVAMSESGLPLIYNVYIGTANKSSSRMRSRLRMRRYMATNRAASIFARSVAATEVLAKAASESDKAYVNFSISQFSDVEGRSGLFVSGPCPFFIFVERGYPRIHALYHRSELTTDSGANAATLNRGVLSFSELNYICTDPKIRGVRGFISVADNGDTRLRELPDPGTMSLDCPSPLRKIALRCTPHKVAYHAGSATYGVLASMPTLTTREERLNRILQSLEKHDKRHYQHTVAQAEAESGDGRVNRVPPLFEELHELRVYIAETMELKMSYKLQKGEVGLAIANMNVNVFKQRIAGPGVDIPSSHRGEDGNESLFAASLKMRPKNLLVVGTGYLNGEDATSKGRLLLFEVSRLESISVQGTRFKQFQLFLIGQKELPSPVTAVASMEGYVICGVGPQISVYKLVGDEIVHLSFAFGQLFCTSISSLKQYVVAGDIRKSVSFMYFRERNSSVNFLGKDYEHVSSHATEFLVRNDDVSIIMSDGEGNVHVLSYAHASVPESRGGKRLLVQGGVSFGSQINKFVRVRDAGGTTSAFRENRSGSAGRHALAFTTVDGGIGMVVSVDEDHFQTIQGLAKSMEDGPFSARYSGIHPAEVNKFRPESTSTELLAQRLCDSRAALEFFGLPTSAAAKVARELGTNVVKISEVVADLDGVLTAFG